jgi:hypothetical protein
METLDAILPPETAASTEKIKNWPMEVRALLTYLARPRLGDNRRRLPRNPLRLQMTLQFQDDNGQTTNAIIYTRDTSAMVLGFLTLTPPKPGQSVVLKFDDATGVTRRLAGRVVRCRQVRDGWYEGTIDLGRQNQSSAAGSGLWRKLRGLVAS